MPRLIVKLEPGILKWIRESSGWNIEEVSKKLNITTKVVKELESGEKHLTLGQLRKLSFAFNRPLALFFLSKPKEEKPLPQDYRLLPNKKGVFDKKTIRAIRMSRNLQELGADLSSNIKLETKPKIKKNTLATNPNIIAAKYRELFQLTLEKQQKFSDSNKLFNYLRDKLESINILVFKFSMPIEDARGFALVDKSPAVMVVNSQDGVEARLFTLMHEFGHVLLGETVIAMPDISMNVRNRVEQWCNQFSSSFLLPPQEAKSIFEENLQHLTETKTLNKLSKKYKISKAVLLRKMLDLNYISKNQFGDILGRFVPETKEKIDSKNNKFSISQDQKRFSEIGNRFVSLVADNFERNLITYPDALDCLSVKSKHFEKIISKVHR